LLWGAVAAIAIAAGAVYIVYHAELGVTRDAASRGSLIANTAAGPIEYADWSTGTPLLSIHGAGGGFDQGLTNVTGLIGDGFRIIAPSRFGYLRTPVPQDSSPAAQADAHAALLAKLNASKAVVLGISAGTRSAVELALRHPNKVAALILIVPALYAPTNPPSIEASRGSKFMFWVVNVGGDFIWWAAEKIAPSMLIRFIGVDPGLVAAAPRGEQERVMHLVGSVEPLSLRFAGINVDSTPELPELPLDKITAPTLIISARDDLFNTLPAAEFTASRIPGARLIVCDTGGHLLVGRGREVSAEVQAFLAAFGLSSPHDVATSAARP
jgi:pimeloyl-ACP methyl ester carboxylesterase